MMATSSYDDLARAEQWSSDLLRFLGIDPAGVVGYSLHHHRCAPIELTVTYQLTDGATVTTQDRAYEVRAVPVEPQDPPRKGGSATFGPPPRGRGSTSESTP